MSSELLLRATGLSKIYCGTSHPFATLCHVLFGTPLNDDDKYPVLETVDIDVYRGEAVGIMGRNGAGKTTLLGMLGKVIQPTSGTIERYGRVATLLGMTAGFNPDFSGGENAYLFCSIHGLSNREADARMSAIEAFADIGRYFKMPLRTYSSGMQARLAFACAVHVSADLIIIDETLAVGDANFRMKCYDRIRQMKADGQTFLLVSHNPNLVANFCTRGVVLEGGRKKFDGPTFEAIEVYKRIRTEAMGDSDLKGRIENSPTHAALPGEVTLENIVLAEEKSGDPVGLITGRLTAHRDIENVAVNFGVVNQQGIVACAFDGVKAGQVIPFLKAGETRELEMRFYKRMLPGQYFFTFIVNELVGEIIRPQSIYQNHLSFDVTGQEYMSGIADLDMSLVMREPQQKPERKYG